MAISSSLLHQRLSPPSFSGLQLFLELLLCLQIPFVLVQFVLELNRHVLFFSNSDSITIALFDLIHCDLWGPHKYSTSCGSFYFFTMIEDYSRAMWVYMLSK